MRVGLFDSGLGGLNVLSELIKKYPNNHYIYYGDTKNLPYGDKTKEQLLSIVKKIMSFFEEKKVDLIIIACGTISSSCFNELKEVTKIPLYDIISPTINYLEKKEYNKISVIATNITIDSHAFKDRLLSYVFELATPLLVPMIEKNNIDEEVIKDYMNILKGSDALVLGCTHYPILVPYFKKYLDEKTELVDMGKVLKESLILTNNDPFIVELTFSKVNDLLVNNINKILCNEYTITEINQ